MSYIEFEGKLLYKIEYEKSDSIKSFLEENNKLVSEYLNNENDTTYVKEFVSHLNDHLLDMDSFKVMEVLLKHPLMTLVRKEFKESDILIKACNPLMNTKLIKWLLKLPVNLGVQDREGVTALMKAASLSDLEFVVDHLLSNTNKTYLNLEDKNGNTALFYSVKNPSVFTKLLKRGMDYNHVNGDGDSLLMCAAKRGATRAYETLIKKPDINYNQMNNAGNNLLMILAKKNNYKALSKLKLENYKIDVKRQNKAGETVTTVFFKSFYNELEQCKGKDLKSDYILKTTLEEYAKTLMALIDLRCNFNVPMDDAGNTPIMMALMMKDYITCYYLLRNDPSINLSIRNRDGINATYLSLFIKMKDIIDIQNQLIYNITKFFSYTELKKLFLTNKTYDFAYADAQHHNTPLIYEIYKNDPITPIYPTFLTYAPDQVLNYVNDKQENGLIMATKLGKTEIVQYMLQPKDRKTPLTFNINHSDVLGNTALHYAVKTKDLATIQLLLKYQANPTLKNKDGKSPLTFAQEMNDDHLVKVLQTPPPPSSTEKHKKLFGRFKKDKSAQEPPALDKTDEELNLYIKKYQAKEYDNDYNYMKNNENNVSLYRFPLNLPIQKLLTKVYYNEYYKERDMNVYIASS